MCFICDRIEMIKNGSNPYFVKELETGYVVIGDNQHFYGYTLFLYKNHSKTELFQLEISERNKFLEEMSIVAEAVSNAFGAEKMNYELLGNGEAHLHWHLLREEKVILKTTATTVQVLYGGIPWRKCIVRVINRLTKTL